MTNIMKSDGKTEDFNRGKIEHSVRNAGADKKTAKEIAQVIPENAAMTTRQIRKNVAEELQKRDPETAKRYKETVRLAAHEAVEAAKGTARMTLEVMNRLNLKPGDPIELEYGNTRYTLKADAGATNSKNVRLHREDLTTIGVPEGTRVAVQKGR